MSVAVVRLSAAMSSDEDATFTAPSGNEYAAGGFGAATVTDGRTDEVGAGVGVGAKVGAGVGVGAKVGAGVGVGAKVGAGVGVKAEVGTGVGVVGAAVDVGRGVAVGAEVGAAVDDDGGGVVVTGDCVAAIGSGVASRSTLKNVDANVCPVGVLLPPEVESRAAIAWAPATASVGTVMEVLNSPFAFA